MGVFRVYVSIGRAGGSASLEKETPRIQSGAAVPGWVGLPADT